ncbi:PREDICTED: NXPE family member 3-like [Branchiostoma belcheri]|uniref:NXPE family member 3-like n=1 Tax=Branchiostoma belcheri TaxID=7741 RepID=A0A6P4YBZ0_BRABE|nr:PREDICTED: NXPE family member 3-like [Branchiostoma belcheri]
MGAAVYLFLGRVIEQSWRLSTQPVQTPPHVSRNIFLNSSQYKTTPEEEGARLSSLLQEFSGSYRDIPPGNDTTTSAEFTQFHIVNPGSVFRVGDVLFVTIRAMDIFNREKTHGGDFFRAKIYTEKTKSSAPGRVRDYGNGTYGVTFRLLWEGDVTVSVRMIHTSSAVRVMKLVAENFPFNRSRYQRKYIYGNKSSVSWCSLNLNDLKDPLDDGICDFSDSYAGVQWFCQKPRDVTCEQSVFHRHNGALTLDNLGLTEEEMGHFKLRVTKTGNGLEAIKATIQGKNTTVKVTANFPGASREEELPSCVPGLPAPVPSGYYRNGRWVSRICATTKLAPLEYKKCLQNKTIDFLGDSTLRQWIEFLAKLLDMDRIPDPYFTSDTVGPERFMEPTWNISSRYQSHGPPVKTLVWSNASVMSSLVRVIDNIAGGPNRVVVITLGMHFSNHPLDVFIRRARAVRDAILRLLSRQPETIIVMKTPNTSSSRSFYYTDDWSLFQMYLVMKEIFSGLSVVFVDAWEMTDCQFHEDNIHPPNDVIGEEVAYMLAYVCV